MSRPNRVLASIDAQLSDAIRRAEDEAKMVNILRNIRAGIVAGLAKRKTKPAKQETATPAAAHHD